jgi:AraC-like DNA-binding protein
MESKVVPIDPRQAELVARVARAVPADGAHPTPFAPLTLYRASEVVQPLPAVYVPSLCVVVQGRKRALVGNESYYYDPFNYLLVSVTLPIFGQILDASPERPYLCIRLDIDLREVGSMLLDMRNDGPPAAAPAEKPLYVARVSSELTDVLLRLVRLLDSPADLAALAPLALRELWYRLLRGEMGPRLRDLIEAEGAVQRVNRSIELLRKRYAEAVRVEELADVAHMSLSTFHARFKAVTSLSPLQFQKQLRLHEARRLMMSDGLEAAAACYRVGYESPSQFSREYRRLFGAPPRREVAALRRGSATEVSSG